MSMLQGFTQGINVRIVGSSNLGDTMSEAVGQMDRFKTSAKSLMKVGGWALGVGTALAGFAAMTVKSTTDTTKALGEMASLGFVDLQSLEKAAGEFSSQFAGVTKPDFIAAAYDIKSGIASLSDVAVGQFTKIAALTAKATKASVAEMTSLFATGYGIYKDFYGSLSDFEFGELFSGGIAESVRAFKTTGPQMAAAISNLGASATSAKRPLEEQLAVLGALQATMGGAEAGTHYRAFIKSAAEAGQQLGISFVDARNNLLPVVEILQRIKGKYGETVDAMEKIELQKAFGRIEAMAAVDLLLPQIGSLTSTIEMLGAAMQGGTATTLRMAESMNRDLGAAFGLLKQRVHNAFEVLGKSILPLVSPMIEAASQAALAFQQWGEAHPGLVKLGMGVTLVGGAILTVLGGLAMAGGLLQLGMTGVIGLAASLGIGTTASLTFTTALGGLAGALWAVLWPLLPIAAAAGLLYLAWKSNFLGIRDTGVAVWAALKAVFNALKTTILAVWGVISPVFSGWISSLGAWFTGWNDGLTGVRSPLLKFMGLIAYAVGFSNGILGQLFGWFKQHKALGAGLGLVFMSGAFGILKYARATGGLINAVCTLPYYLRVAGAELKYLTMRMAAFDPATLPTKIKGAFTAMTAAVRSSVVGLRVALVRGLSAVWDFTAGLVRASVAWTVSVARGLGFVVKQLGLLGFSMLKAASQVALFAVRMIAAKVVMLAQAVATGVVTAAQLALNVAMTANPIGLIIAGVGLLIAGIVLLYKHWDQVWVGMKATVDWVWSALTTSWQAVVGFFGKGVEWIASVFNGLGNTLAGIFSSVWSSVKTAFIEVLNWIIGKLNLLLTPYRALAGLVGLKLPQIPTLATGNAVMNAQSGTLPEPMSSSMAANKTVISPVLNVTPAASPLSVAPAPIITPASQTATIAGSEVFKPAPTGNIVRNAITTDARRQTVQVDRSIRDIRITINAAADTSKSIKDQLLEVFAEMAAQGDSLEGVAFDG